jgi:hypothetical protein
LITAETIQTSPFPNWIKGNGTSNRVSASFTIKHSDGAWQTEEELCRRSDPPKGYFGIKQGIFVQDGESSHMP